MLPTKVHCAHYVACIGTASDQGRTLVNHGVLDHAGFVIAGIPGAKQSTSEAGSELLDHWLSEGL